MEILRVENLCKTYGKGANEVKALDNVSFSVNKGEFIAAVSAALAEELGTDVTGIRILSVKKL